MLEVQSVTKKYRKKIALDSVSFVVEKGSVHGLIGENCAGKTTLLKVLAGVYPCDGGTVLYDGKPIYDNPQVLDRVGYVADSNEYFPGYTIRKMTSFYQNVFSGFDRERFEELNAVFGLDERQKISTLSKGQKVRLAFMLNIARTPEYLLLDEPTANIDPAGKKDMLRILVEEVEERGMTVVVSSHQIQDLEGICDGITMIKKGKVQFNSSVLDAKKQYVKCQIVFKNGAPEGFYNWKEIRTVSSVGSIYTVIFSDYSEEVAQRIFSMGAELVEPMEITLEELFMLSVKEGGDGNKQ